MRRPTTSLAELLPLAQAPAAAVTLDSVATHRSGLPRLPFTGYQLLGHALAAAAGTTYAGLFSARIAGPVGLDVLYAPSSPAQLRPGAVRGRSRRGRPQEAWASESVAPAGGLRSTATDLARLVGAMLDGTAPGLAALDPVADLGRGARVGAAWITIDDGGRQVTWHNGGTGGFRSWVGMDRAARRGVVLLTATSRSVDAAGFRLLRELGR